MVDWLIPEWLSDIFSAIGTFVNYVVDGIKNAILFVPKVASYITDCFLALPDFVTAILAVGLTFLVLKAISKYF